MPDSSDTSRDVGPVLGRIHGFGTAVEQVFSRVYRALGNRATREQQQVERQRRRQELETKINKARQIASRNQQLRQMLQQQSEFIEQLQGMLAAIDEGIIMQDLEGRIVYLNQAAQNLLGSHKNIWKTDLGRLFNQYADVDKLESEIEPLGTPDRIQVNNRVLGAQLAAVANTNGDRLGTMIVLRDVTRDALADRLKDQFVTALSHELKTPMTVIKGMSEVLRSQPDDRPPNQRLLETLSRNVDILDRMVVELLDVSEMGAGTFDIRETPIDLERLLWTVVHGLQPEIDKKHLGITVMMRDNRHFRVRGDDERLRWAVGHILQNSIHYTETGGLMELRVYLDEDPRYIRVDFLDTGVGIADRDTPHIFERFYRGDPRNSEGRLIDPRGLGQGLFIARTVAEAHGGYLGLLETQVGEGSTFTLVLPRHVDD